MPVQRTGDPVSAILVVATTSSRVVPGSWDRSWGQVRTDTGWTEPSNRMRLPFYTPLDPNLRSAKGSSIRHHTRHVSLLVPR